VVQGLLPSVEKRHVTYGFSPQADVRATDVSFDGLSSRFTAVVRGRSLGRVQVAMPGRHNVLNSLAVLAVTEFLGIDFEVAAHALETFTGVGRRFTVRGEAAGVMVVDDYGHHPEEVRATLAGARAGFSSRRIVAAFQPHRYTRTRDLLGDFARAFNEADVVVVSDIYAAGEEPIAGVSSAALVDEMRRSGHKGCEHVARRADVASALLPQLRSGDIVITLGAGDIWQAGEELLGLLGSRGLGA
jgi:UDP-N-acetylmuramate--alanine ligase